MSESSQREPSTELERRPKNTWAIASYMLGLIAWICALFPGLMFSQSHLERWLGIWWEDAAKFLFPAAICALVGSIIFGFVARSKARRNPMLQCTWAARYGLILSFALLFMFPLLIPASGVAREKARRSSCISNLKAISTALTMYADDDPLRRMPGSLEVLTNGICQIDHKDLQCPKHGMKYAYLGSNKIWQSSGREIGVYCNDRHLDKANVLYLDGRVATVLPVELESVQLPPGSDPQTE